MNIKLVGALMDAIYRTCIHTSLVFDIDARLADHIGAGSHGTSSFNCHEIAVLIPVPCRNGIASRRKSGK
jgi:hypothetical protein